MTVVAPLKKGRGDSREGTVRIEVPREFSQALIRLMAAYNLDLDGGLRKAAVLIDSRREEFDKAVQDGAARLAKSSSMTMLNKSRKTISESAYKAGISQFRYRCNICGQIIEAQPELEWKWLLEKGYLSTWGHKTCQERQPRV